MRKLEENVQRIIGGDVSFLSEAAEKLAARVTHEVREREKLLEEELRAAKEDRGATGEREVALQAQVDEWRGEVARVLADLNLTNDENTAQGAAADDPRTDQQCEQEVSAAEAPGGVQHDVDASGSATRSSRSPPKRRRVLA